MRFGDEVVLSFTINGKETKIGVRFDDFPQDRRFIDAVRALLPVGVVIAENMFNGHEPYHGLGLMFGKGEME